MGVRRTGVQDASSSAVVAVARGGVRDRRDGARWVRAGAGWRAAGWCPVGDGRQYPGLTVLLSEPAMATLIAPVSARTPEGVYFWPMFSSSVYGGGALWVTTQTGLVACVNPATGRVRATETVRSQAAQLGGLLAADRPAWHVFGFVANDGYNGLVSISPPRSCWG